MTVSEIRTAQQNGLTLAFLSEAEKAELSARAAQRSRVNPIKTAERRFFIVQRHCPA
jgi:adenosine deaminase